MTKTYEWTTAKGNKISMTITTESGTREITRDLDGYQYTETIDFSSKNLNSLSINGEVKPLAKFETRNTIFFGRQGKDRLLVMIPEDIIADYTPVEDPAKVAARQEKLQKQLESAAKYEAHKAAVYKMMDADNK